MFDPDDFLVELRAELKEEQRKELPDYGIIPYCDKHLAVPMLSYRMHDLSEYGEASASSNRLDYWRCGKGSNCERCYEPRMFGYHWRSIDMGSRIEADQQTQRRGNHPDEPFMYIGKVGQGRRYLCPLYKCDEQGDEIATVVVDEAPETPSDPLVGMSNDERKQVLEMAVFKSFASASGLSIDEGSALNVKPPNPDIRCTITGKPHYFELGQIISEKVAEKTNPKVKKSAGGFSFSQEKPFQDIIEKKKNGTYATEGAPVDLILYFDLRLGSKSVVERLIDKHGEGLVSSMVTQGPFNRVWIFDDWKKTIVWFTPATAEHPLHRG